MKRDMLTSASTIRLPLLNKFTLSDKAKRITSFTCAALLALLFLYTGIEKLYHHKTFVLQLVDHPFFGNYPNLIAWLLPSLELILAAALLYPRTRLIGFYSSFALLLGFTVYIHILQHFFPRTPCNCGGVLPQLSWAQHKVFNAAFMLVAIIGACMLPEKKKNTTA